MLNVHKSITCTFVKDVASLEKLLDSMTEGMFITDRIFLDPFFGGEYSLRRYRNWIYQEYCRGSRVCHIIYQEQVIGFVLYRIEEGCMHVLLWGLFEPFQRKGLGVIVPLSTYWIWGNAEKFISLETKISSNNNGIISKLCQLGFNFSDM